MKQLPLQKALIHSRSITTYKKRYITPRFYIFLTILFILLILCISILLLHYAPIAVDKLFSRPLATTPYWRAVIYGDKEVPRSIEAREAIDQGDENLGQ